jgi:hypothetical protein
MTGAASVLGMPQAPNTELSDPVRDRTFNAWSKTLRFSSDTTKGKSKMNRGDMKNIVRTPCG